jgi:hypothetical protein
MRENHNLDLARAPVAFEGNGATTRDVQNRSDSFNSNDHFRKDLSFS